MSEIEVKEIELKQETLQKLANQIAQQLAQALAQSQKQPQQSESSKSESSINISDIVDHIVNCPSCWKPFQNKIDETINKLKEEIKNELAKSKPKSSFL